MAGAPPAFFCANNNPFIVWLFLWSVDLPFELYHLQTVFWMNEYLYCHDTLVQRNYAVTPKKWTRNDNTFTETTLKLQDHWLHNAATNIDDKKQKNSHCVA